MANDPRAVPRLGAARAGALLAGFAVLAFAVYRPALSGPPLSDDFPLFLNPWVQQPTPANLLALLDPWSDATLSLINYAPVRPLLQAFLWWLSPQDSPLYHVVNVGLHVAATVALVAFFVRLALPFGAAAIAGLLFLVHPANVEAVAWMAQVWSSLALLFSLAALLWLPRRPALATAVFALALLTKPTAVFALPVALALAWTGAGAASERDRRPALRWGWLAAWAALCVVFAVLQIAVFGDSGQVAPRDEGLLERARLMASIALRYLVMAVTSYGVSVAQEPARPVPWSDPWFLASLPVLVALAVRLAGALRARRTEAVAWAFALGALAPVSQVFPFLHPLADRYLYFILPGLLLAGACVLVEALAAIPDAARRRTRARATGAAVLVACVAFAVRSHDRAFLWRSEAAQLAEAARNFPDGISAHLARARALGESGDAAGEIAELEAAEARGFLLHGSSLGHPSFRRVREDPRYAAYRLETTARTLDRIARKPRVTPLDLREAAVLYELRGEGDRALEAIDRALGLSEPGGPLDAALRAERERLRAARVGSAPPGSSAPDPGR